MSQFKPLAFNPHSHNDQGSNDSASNPATMVKRAKNLGRLADAITDHGTMCSLASHWFAAKKAGIKSIHGIELYLPDLQKSDSDKDFMHLTVLFKDIVAYKYFCKLSAVSATRNKKHTVVLWDELIPIVNHIMIGSGCLTGPIQKRVKEGDLLSAEQNYLWLRTLAGEGNFFVEVLPFENTHSWMPPKYNNKEIVQSGYFKPNEFDRNGQPVDIQKAPNQFVVEMANKYNDLILISEDSHYSSPELKVVQDMKLGRGTQSWKMYNTYCMQPTEVHADVLRRQLGISDEVIAQWVENSYTVLEKFNDYTFLTAKDQWLLPTVEQVYGDKYKGKTTKQIAKELVLKHGRFPGADTPKRVEYVERYNREIAVLADNGKADFLPYFFVIEDLCDWCKRNGLLVNARGSGGGSLLLYLLGGSITDPIQYDLSFERFLTLGRILSGSLPDLDLDFSYRELVLDYLKQKYGDCFARISISSPLKVKSTIKDAERELRGSVSIETNAMCKQIPTIPQGIEADKWLWGYTEESTEVHVPGFWDTDEAEELRGYAADHPDIWNIVTQALGVSRQRSQHACGHVISPVPITDIMPVVSVGGDICTAYGPKDVENIGGIKFDFLSVNTLTSLAITVKSIKERKGVTLPWQERDYNPKVYQEIVEKDKLHAIFQLNTRTVRPFVKKIKPLNVHDISVTTALIRPGSLEAPSPHPDDIDKPITAVDFFIDCKNKFRSPYYIHPDLEPILQETQGVIVFQEQALRIFRDIGGMTYEQAEVARRAIGKKDKEVLAKEISKLIAACIKRGWTKEQASLLGKTVIKSARYSFNRSHSTSYAIVAYNGAWLKYHYPADFWLGELTVNAGDIDKTRLFLEECGSLILPVDILKSHSTEWRIEEIDGQDFLRPPLVTVKDVGEVSARDLRSFIDIDINSIQVKDKKPIAPKKPRKKKEAVSDTSTPELETTNTQILDNII